MADAITGAMTPALAPAIGLMVTSSVRLERPLGVGGMGSVWVAEHLALRTQVVVKFMSADLAASPEAVARFSREAAAASQVKSPHVVQTLDYGVMKDGTPYIVMELLEGHDLSTHLERAGTLLPTEVIAIVGQLARALTKAHERGIVHRDIKPSNIFLCDAGGGELFVKLLDFGIAKAQTLKVTDDTTRTGAFVGSPFYMSPEQVIGAKNIDFRSDLWSLGVVTFEALTGKKPFFAETVGGLALKIHRDPLPMPTTENRKLPRALDDWFMRACAREAGERFASAKEMADALAMALTGEPLNARAISSAPRAPKASELAATTPAKLATVSTLRSSKLATGATDAGVGLGTRASFLPSRSRGKVMVALGVIAVAIGVGFLVPRLMRGDDPRGLPRGAGATTNAPASAKPPSSASAAATQTVSAPAASSTASPPATVASSASPAVLVAPPPPTRTAGTVTTFAAPPPLPSVSAKAAPTATSSPADDDIK